MASASGHAARRGGFKRPPDVQVNIFPVRAQALLRSAVGIVGEFSVSSLLRSIARYTWIYTVYIRVCVYYTHIHVYIYKPTPRYISINMCINTCICVCNIMQL